MAWHRVGKFLLQAPLEESGRSLVYRAVNQDTQQVVALKLVPADKFPDQEARQRFLDDARRALGLAHPHLRALYELDEAEGQLTLAMEYLEGVTLKHVLVGGRPELETGLAWAAEAADGLAALHSRGLVHGDVRPGKIFITEEGTVKLLDAGLWRLTVPADVDLSQEAARRELGLGAKTLAGLAPERIRGGKPSPASDIFSLGAVVYEMVSGRQPFLGRNLLHTLHLVQHRPPEPLRVEAPPGMDAVLACALEKKPQARFRSAAEFAAALRELATGQALPAGLRRRRLLMRLSSPFWVAIGILLLLLVAWFTFLALTQP